MRPKKVETRLQLQLGRWPSGYWGWGLSKWSIFNLAQAKFSLTSLFAAFLQVVCPYHVNLSNFSCELLFRLSNLEVGIYDPIFKSIWSRYH